MPYLDAQDQIEIIGAAENNLKDVDVTIPKGKLIVFVGVSGSGKSSLVFDTIAAESSREWQETYPLFYRNRLPRYERPHFTSIRGLTPSVVDQKAIGANARSTVGTASDVAPLVRLLFSRVGKPSAGGSMAYSFNHPHGMCPECTGLGEKVELDESRLFDMEKSINEGGIRFTQFCGGSWQEFYFKNNPLFSPDKKLKDFTPEEWKALTVGPDEPLIMNFMRHKTGQISQLPYEGVIPRFNRIYVNRDTAALSKAVREEAASFMRRTPCPACGGSGLNPKAIASRINGYNIVDFCDAQVSDLLPLLEKIGDPMGSSIAAQIAVCLRRMIDVGLGYLSLSRRTDTLSGGEAQRLKMVRHLGSSLSNVTYIFDEPTAGLHPADAQKIGRLLLELRDERNTVLVVEHSHQIMELADELIELGPGAGEAGGRIVYQGPVRSLPGHGTATAGFLREQLAINPAPRAWNEGFSIEQATLHNLKNISVTIPKGVLTAVTGVAGSGKSTLICHEFVSRYPDAIVVDQKPIGTSNRSTPATYTGVMDEIRKLFAKANKVSAQWFSFNSKGACPACKGKGEITPDVAFADPVTIRCEECLGRRYNPTALSYRYSGKNIEEVMSLTVSQAMDFFPQESIREPLRQLADVGLGYMTLGQPTSTLSGGETQRLKLASELQSKGSVYILDEPTIGLHAQDVLSLLKLLRRLVDAGNTVIVVEHRLDVIAAADWVIDLGPQGGKDGGEILFTGTPGALLDCERSLTARYLRAAVERE